MHGQVLQLPVDHESEDQTEHADHEAEEQQGVPVDPQKRDRRQVGEDQVDLAPAFGGRQRVPGAQCHEGQVHEDREQQHMWEAS